MESILEKPAIPTKIETTFYWVVTALFCLQMAFTAYAQLKLPQVAQMFTHLGFPGYFRVELSWAKVLGVIVILAPFPAGSRSGPTPGSPSRSPRHSSRISRPATHRRSGSGRQERACSGCFPISSGGANEND